MQRATSRTLLASRTFRRTYAVKDPFNAQKDSSQGHATSKTGKDSAGNPLDVQHGATVKGREEKSKAKQGENLSEGEKPNNQKAGKRPDQVMGMQDERGGKDV